MGQGLLEHGWGDGADLLDQGQGETKTQVLGHVLTLVALVGVLSEPVEDLVNVLEEALLVTGALRFQHVEAVEELELGLLHLREFLGLMVREHTEEFLMNYTTR